MGGVGKTLGTVRAGIWPSVPPARGCRVAEAVCVPQCMQLRIGLRSERVSVAKRSDPPCGIHRASPTPIVSGSPLCFTGRGWSLLRAPLTQVLALHSVLIGALVFRLLVQERESAIIPFVARLIRAKTRLEAGRICARAAASWTRAAGAICLQAFETRHPTLGGIQPR